jgi:hypothetical protein
MKKKILVIVICMVMIVPTTILITPEYLQVKAADNGRGGGSLVKRNESILSN